ncbi:hypothetical protein IFT67_12640 [Sphingomonas sp. CFBP 13728]|uniref:hypothetical protein n=1 Tax=Sphingomonas sp. CFBP 13728 TaxID=2775294 RepID=UPI0017845F94|nr:hypothetical protein [Sphingomonas sp. CFBP 13728]MBD8619770.1 hypothetical protein [Sphingomonas sp. CFBP 13728]
MPYLLSSYPQDYVQTVERYIGDAECDLEVHGLTPDTCPHNLIPLFDGARLLNGKLVTEPRWHHVGVTCDRIDLDEHEQWGVWEVDGYPGDALAIMTAYAWADTFTKGNWHVRFTDVDEYSSNHHVWFGFEDADDEIGFLAEMTRFFRTAGARA